MFYSIDFLQTSIADRRITCFRNEKKIGGHGLRFAFSAPSMPWRGVWICVCSKDAQKQLAGAGVLKSKLSPFNSEFTSFYFSTLKLTKVARYCSVTYPWSKSNSVLSRPIEKKYRDFRFQKQTQIFKYNLSLSFILCDGPLQLHG